MVTQYLYGVPVETFAVTAEVPKGGEPPYFSREKGMTFTCPLGEEDVVYGLGETMRGINKRGGRYISFNYDDPHHRDAMPSMYGAHNFIVVDGERTFGAFFDTPAKVVFDVGSSGGGQNGSQDDEPGMTVDHSNLSFTVRHCSETAAVNITRYRILFAGDAYDIVSIDCMGFKRKCYKFKCRKVKR